MLIVPPAEGGEQFFSSTFVDRPDGSVAFRDPMSGEMLTPSAVPDALRTWPILKEGYDFWEQQGDRTDFTLLSSYHGRGADLVEAGIDMRAEAERVAAAGGILLLEGISHPSTAARLTRAYNEVSQGLARPDDYRRFIRSQEHDGITFMSDLLDLVHDTHARIELPDVLLSSGSSGQDLLSPVHTMLGRWFKHLENLKSSFINPRNSRNLLIAETGFHNYREALIVGICGVKLSRFIDNEGSITGALFMGAAHPGVAKKVEVLSGRPVRVVGEINILDEPRYKYTVQGIGDAALSASAIAEFQAWFSQNANNFNRRYIAYL